MIILIVTLLRPLLDMAPMKIGDTEPEVHIRSLVESGAIRTVDPAW